MHVEHALLITLASMGPPPFGSGNTFVLFVFGSHSIASMGPPPFGSGNLNQRRTRQRVGHGFNGATAFRQWKPSSRHGGACRFPCFNGATAFRQWKPGPRLPDHPPLGPASMGPPPFGSGNNEPPANTWLFKMLQWGHRLSAVETSGARPLRRVYPSFNGATAFRQWKPGGGVGGVKIIAASMGPPPFGSGNGPALAFGLSPVCGGFNGATAFRQWKR